MTTTTTPGTIEHIDPQTIDVATNVRTGATLGKEFLDSIRANGVLQPVVAYRDSEAVHVRYGQRRTLAAQMLGLATMPVYVVDVDEADTAQRIIEQLVENDQREALEEADRLDAWRQLELERLTATQIAKRTGTKREKIKTGLTVASSDTGTRLVAEVGLTLDQAATLIEFEDDTETVATLTQTAIESPGYLIRPEFRSVLSFWRIVSFRPFLLEDGVVPGPYPDEFRQRALRMLSEARPDHKTDHAAIKHVAAKLGIKPETLRLWKKRLDVDEGRQPGTSSEAQAEIKRLKKQIAELEKANEILRSASVFFATELGRPSSR
ncbi:ParB N-terminal domain-containing protein [Microbacterium esteraromaticum]|nr:ParB N-terminal domain-containing protein [Microbacterium esteraromaticum]MCA1306956.1 ParB N-terminal domain-containing protein [Microbacterium esteraromaticum]